MDEIMLRGAIDSVHLHDGQLDVTLNGQPMTFSLEAQEARPAQAPKPRQSRRPNGHAQEGPQDAGAEHGA